MRPVAWGSEASRVAALSACKTRLKRAEVGEVDVVVAIGIKARASIGYGAVVGAGEAGGKGGVVGQVNHVGYARVGDLVGVGIAPAAERVGVDMNRPASS